MQKNNSIKTGLLHLVLFVLTLFTTTLAGAEWKYGRLFFINEKYIGWSQWMTQEKFLTGLYFSIPFLGILTIHEFGHYLTAKWYKVKVTLPYYIPFWFGITFSIGTLGAFIKIKSPLKTRKEFFDIGIAGPLAGFIAAIAVLYYGFTHLPPQNYIFEIHPEWQKYGLDYAKEVYKNPEGTFSLGKNLIFWFFEQFVVENKNLIPNAYEMMHYPYLFAGYMALLFTALNLIPIGQLDGGHILYGLIGSKKFNKIAPLFFIIFISYAGLGLISPYDDAQSLSINIPLYLIFLYIAFSKTFKDIKNVVLVSLAVFALQFSLVAIFPKLLGYSGWLAFTFLIGRFLGVYHPPALVDTPLDWKRKILGWLSLVIFILCFSPKPIVIH